MTDRADAASPEAPPGAAVRVDGLSKFYHFHRPSGGQLLDILLGRPLRRRDGHWALREIAFEVGAGSAFGIVGDNGSGKSTLLQIVAGTLRPTSGVADVRGRVSALLDLGAGFNPEFTGRENVFVSGAILGFTRDEMERRFHEIAGFAEIGSFVDQPVKTYSSGMYVRLAFSVATCLDPEVLLIDELLAVGDQYFQKKCVDRIEAFRRAGKTILFCSHNMYLVKQLCDRAVWLREGRMEAVGDAGPVVDAYVDYVRLKQAASPAVAPAPPEARCAWINAVTICDGSGSPCDRFQTGDEVVFRVRLEVDRPGRRVHVSVGIRRNDRVICFTTSTQFRGYPPLVVDGTSEVGLRVKNLPLLSGTYEVAAAVLDDHGLCLYDFQDKVGEFTMTYPGKDVGLCWMDHEWVLPESS